MPAMMGQGLALQNLRYIDGASVRHRGSPLPGYFMNFDLTDLRLFLNVIDSGSITAGSARTHLSLPSGSARVRALEASLGVPLLARGRRGVVPTAAGKALAQHARTIGYQVASLQSDLAEYAKGFKGQVRMLCNTSALSEYLPERLADFLVSHPHIDVDVQETSSLRIVAAVQQGTADLGILSNDVDSGLLETRFFQADPLVLVMPSNHVLSDRASISFAEALNHEFIGVDARTAFSVLVERQALHVGQRMRIRARAESFEGLLRMVARGAGLGIAPEAAVMRCHGDLKLVTLPLKEPWADRSLLLCCRSFADLPPYAAQWVDAITHPPG